MKLLHFAMLIGILTFFMCFVCQLQIASLKEFQTVKQRTDQALDDAVDLTGRKMAELLNEQRKLTEETQKGLYEYLLKAFAFETDGSVISSIPFSAMEDGFLFVAFIIEEKMSIWQKGEAVFHCILGKEECVLRADAVEKALNRFLEQNEYAQSIFGASKLALPNISDSMWGEPVQDIALLVGYVNLKQSCLGEFVKSISGVNIQPCVPYCVTMTDRKKQYHRSDCGKIQEGDWVSYFYTQRECAEFGAYPCEACIIECMWLPKEKISKVMQDNMQMEKLQMWGEVLLIETQDVFSFDMFLGTIGL